MTFLIWMYFLPPAPSHTHLQGIALSASSFIQSQSLTCMLCREWTDRKWHNYFPSITTFWVRLLLPCYDLQSSWHSCNCVTPYYFPLYTQQAVTLSSLRSPPRMRQALCIPPHLRPGTRPSSHTGPPS